MIPEINSNAEIFVLLGFLTPAHTIPYIIAYQSVPGIPLGLLDP